MTDRVLDRSGTSVSTVDQIVAVLRDRIKQGELVSGQRLVEPDLTRELGVSRNPLRDAFGRLATEGLVVIERNRGASVRRLSLAEVRELYQVREALESEAAALAATRVDAAGRRQLRDRIAAHAEVRHGQDLIAYHEQNEQFHQLIVRLSDNALLGRLTDQLYIQAFRVQFRHLLTPSAIQNAVTEHEETAEAIHSGDPNAAEAAMRRHIRNSADLILDRLDPTRTAEERAP